MKNRSGSSSSRKRLIDEKEELVSGSKSGCVEPRTRCDHLITSLSSDLIHIPLPDTPCSRCQNPNENWLCLSCKEVFCSRFVNRHMLEHFQETKDFHQFVSRYTLGHFRGTKDLHCIALSYSDLSVWCFACDAYLDGQRIRELRPVHDTAYMLKFGQPPPIQIAQNQNNKRSE